MGACPFCDIAQGKGASIVYQDNVTIAFLDSAPVNPEHLLVVPKRHVRSLADLDEATGAHLFQVAMRVAQAVRCSGVRCEGVNLLLADGEAAFQEIFHLHLHVIPRFKGDAFKVTADWSVKPPRAELAEIAARIQDAYAMIYG